MILAVNNKTSDFDVFSRLGMDADSSRILVVGLGKTGLSVACFLASYGFHITVTDSRENPPGLQELVQRYPETSVFLAGFSRDAFDAATHVIVSPGVALQEPEVERAANIGKPVFGDLDLFACVTSAPVIGITGSNGKSTVTSLVGLMASHAGRKAAVGGNLGTPVLDLLTGDSAPADLYVLELSSFQLERSVWLEPSAATVLNVSSDHLDRYPDLETYASAKRRIFSGTGTMVLNQDDPCVARMALPNRNIVCFGMQKANKLDYWISDLGGDQWLIRRGERFLPARQIKIKGQHNLSNALAAIALGDALGFPAAAMKKALTEFSGLPHRMQWVAERNGVIWINDSKATNVGACRAALEGISGQVILIAGGDAKGAEFSDLVNTIREKARGVILIGKDAGLLAREFGGAATLVTAGTLRRAVDAAASVALPGDTVLLSPACASLDQFTDYQERGRDFVQAVMELQE